MQNKKLNKKLEFYVDVIGDSVVFNVQLLIGTTKRILKKRLFSTFVITTIITTVIKQQH